MKKCSWLDAEINHSFQQFYDSRHHDKFVTMNPNSSDFDANFMGSNYIEYFVSSQKTCFQPNFTKYFVCFDLFSGCAVLKRLRLVRGHEILLL